MNVAQPRPRTAVCTIISKNYLAYARTLMDSVRTAHPEWEQYVLLADEPEEYFEAAQERFHMVSLDELDLPNRQKFLFRYTLLEANTAVKPWMLAWLFEFVGADHVVYLDPDIYVYHPLAEVTDLLDRGVLMVLTAHLNAPLTDGKLPSERNILQAGCYNLGFIALARHPELKQFLFWWQRKLEFDCRVELAAGLFVDQRWIDLAPGLFADVAILRHPAYNVAYWNLASRAVAFQNGIPCVGNDPLVFFHFSGLNPESPDNFSKHQNRFHRKNMGDAWRLVDAYSQSVLANGWQECKRWPYAFGRLKNGDAIPDVMRRYYRNHPVIQTRAGDDPFDFGHDYLNEPWSGCSSILITRLARALWESDKHLQSAYPDLAGVDAEGFARQFAGETAREAGCPEKFIAPVRESLRCFESLPPEIQRANQRYFHENPTESHHPATPIVRMFARVLVTCLPVPRDRDRLRRWIKRFRPLIRLFPEALRRDIKNDLLYSLNRRYAERRVREAGRLLKTLGRWMRMLWPTTGQPTLVEKSVELPIEISAKTHEPQSATESPAQPRLWINRAPVTFDEDRITGGVNLVGYALAPTGVGESVRLAAAAARAVGMPISTHDLSEDARFQTAGPYVVNLLHVNADQTPVVRQTLGEDFFAHRHNIGYWHWELGEFPDRWRNSFDLLDEIWVPSRFIQDAVSAKSFRPVVRIPHGINVTISPDVTRESMSLPSGKFLFLTMFDTESYQSRKNPEGAIEAFRRSFAGSDDVMLVVKVNHARNHPEGMARLKKLLRNLPNVVLLEKPMTRQNVNDLQSLCDCHLSLHRSEGFGLGLAEAMFLGKPVIATGWSGNTDFMTEENSFPVRYRLIPLTEDVGPYDRGQVWADPDVNHAANLMKKVVAEPTWRETVASRGRETIRTEYAPERIGRMYRQRIGEIHRMKSEMFRSKRVA